MDEENVAGPSAKRRRLEAGPAARSAGESRLFSPFRSIGLVSPTSVPFTSVPLGKSTFQITTSIGRNLQTYDLRRGLQLVFLSRPQCPHRITATCAYRDRVIAAWGGSEAGPRGVWVFKRGVLLAELESTDTTQQIEKLLVFGKWIVACGTTAIEVWNTKTYEHYATIFPSAGSGRSKQRMFTGSICTMPTFLNKVFVGLQDGAVEIYNVSTAKHVHTIEAPPASGRVTAMHPALAVGILAVAYADGSLRLFHVDTDEIIMSLQSRGRGAITSISFRSDGSGAGANGQDDGVMATASLESGDITFWDLNRCGKVAGILRAAHVRSTFSGCSGIAGIEFLPGQNILVSSGLDNALRTWIFDQNQFSTIPRLLHSRSGHGAPVSELTFLPAASDGSEASGKWLLSAGHDRSLWAFSLRKDGQNSELSQGNGQHKARNVGKSWEDDTSVDIFKAAVIVDMACSLNRDGGMAAVGGRVWANERSTTAEESSTTGWESIITAHADDKFARTWSWGKKKAGRWAFESGDHKPVTSVAITACGTFALVGSSGGAIDMFNLQSGAHRQRFPARVKPGQVKDLRHQGDTRPELLAQLTGHSNAITGMAVDSLNQILISISLDGSVLFWDFATGHVVKRLVLPSAAALRMKYNSVANLIALACDDLCIRVIDIGSHRVVRELWGCAGQINDLTFSHDGRWIVACSMDSVVRVFDLATGHLVDGFRIGTCTNVAFSPTGEYLATTHAGTLGITIWNNKSLYTHIPLHQISDETGIIDLTATSAAELVSQTALNTQAKDDRSRSETIDTISTVTQLDGSLLTLSLAPRSRWQTLLNLENIRQRNRPIQPPEKPKVAPFFLGSSLALSALTPQQGAGTTDESRLTRLEDTKIAAVDRLAERTIASVLGEANTLPEDSQKVVDHMITLPPSATDLFIRTLGVPEIKSFINILTSHLQCHRDYELISTWMAVVLRVHGDYVTEVDEIRHAVTEWRQTNERTQKRLDAEVGYASGVLGSWLRSAR